MAYLAFLRYLAFEWLRNNDMKANPDKCEIFVSKSGSFVANAG